MKALHAALITLSLGLGACASQVPIPTTYDLTYQRKMQAAHHWDVLAEHVAGRIHEALAPPGQTGQTNPLPMLHVQYPEENVAFHHAFQDLLITRLVERGFLVSRNPGTGLRVVNDIQLITHADRGYIRPRPAAPSMLAGGTALAAGMVEAGAGGAAAGGAIVAYDIASGSITGPVPDSEILVNTSVMSGDSYRARFSDIYYVSDPNRGQYAVVDAQPLAVIRRMEVVDQ